MRYVHAAAARNRLKAKGFMAFLGTTHLVGTKGKVHVRLPLVPQGVDEAQLLQAEKL